MYQFSINPMAGLAFPLAEEFKLYRRIGVDSIGVSFPKGAAAGWSRVRELATAHGLAIEYLCLGLTNPVDSSGYRADMETLRDAVRAASDLGAATVYCTSGPSGKLSWADAAQRAANLLGPVADSARTLGISLALENTMSIRADLGFTHSVRDAAELARLAGAGLCVDLYCCWQEAGLAETLRTNLELIRLLQVSDFKVGTMTMPNRWPPGDGDIPLGQLLDTARAAGYRGVIDLELLGPAIEREGAELALRRGISWLTSWAADRRSRC